MTRGELAAHKNETGLMKLTMMGRRSSAWIATVAAAFVAAVTLVQPAFAQQIVVRGNQRVNAETIRSYVTGTGAGFCMAGNQSVKCDQCAPGYAPAPGGTCSR